jgi:hypothetical protein
MHNHLSFTYIVILIIFLYHYLILWEMQETFHLKRRGAIRKWQRTIFIIDSSHLKRYPNLLREMNSAHVSILQEKLFRKKDADALFLLAYLEPLVKAVGSGNSTSDEVNNVILDRSLLEKHKVTKSQRRTWS